jgi:hypothetical protein
MISCVHNRLCRYRLLNKTDYPYWSVGALATANHYYQDEPLHVRLGLCLPLDLAAAAFGWSCQVGIINPQLLQTLSSLPAADHACCALQGCGECFEVQCLENVSAATLAAIHPLHRHATCCGGCSLRSRGFVAMPILDSSGALQGPLGDKPGSCQSDPNNRTIVIMISGSCAALIHAVQASACCLAEDSAYGYTEYDVGMHTAGHPINSND